MTRKIQDGRRLPYLLTDVDQIWACETRPPGNPPIKV